MILQQSLAQLFNSHWHNSSTVAAMLIQQSLARLFNSHWHDCPTVTVRTVEQSLAKLFNSGWHDFSTVTGTIIQQSLAWLINSGWHDSSTVTGVILQHSLAGLFNSHGQILRHLNCRYRPCFKQEVTRHSGNYKVWIHAEECTWHDKNMQYIYHVKEIIGNRQLKLFEFPRMYSTKTLNRRCSTEF